MNGFLRIMCLLFLAPSLAHAQMLEASVKRWNVYQLAQEGEPRCYMASAPIREQGSFKKRGQPYLMVTDRGVRADEVSVSSGYPYRAGSEPALAIGATSFGLTVEGETAWTHDLEEDAKAVALFKSRNEAVVRGTSQRGTVSEDTYSLAGFTQAYDRMKSLCQSN